jgi:DNA segregation ATPase FtsK/SpoIIIE-like protein
MSIFSPTRAPESSPSGTNVLRDEIVEIVGEKSYDLYPRAVELVIRSQAFSRNGLRDALRLTVKTAADLTRGLEAQHIIATGAVNERRQVLVPLDELGATLSVLR